MSKTEDGGPAFPRTGHEIDRFNSSVFDTLPQVGMTIRDFFAAAALTGLLSAETEDWNYDNGDGTNDCERAADAAYHFADAMIAHRKGGAA